MLTRLVNRLRHDQKGITGLETAIILIAFVVVAAVFAYTVLSAGLFATEESSETVYAGLEETKSTLELRGGVTAYASIPAVGADVNAEDIDGSDELDILQTRSTVTRIQFTVANVMGGEPIDLSPSYTATAVDDPNGPSTLAPAVPDNHETIISYRDAYHLFSDCAWTVDWIGAVNEDNLLEQDEKAVITIWLAKHAGDNTTAFNLDAAGSDTFWDEDDDVANSFINTSADFSIEIKTPKGAVMTLDRTTPAYLDNVMDLH